MQATKCPLQDITVDGRRSEGAAETVPEATAQAILLGG
jgi:hypothetical protein